MCQGIYKNLVQIDVLLISKTQIPCKILLKYY